MPAIHFQTEESPIKFVVINFISSVITHLSHYDKSWPGLILVTQYEYV